MDWQENHKKRVDGFPADVKAAHTHSSNHRAEVTASALCGCFYSCSRFDRSEVIDWIDDDQAGWGKPLFVRSAELTAS